VAGRLTSSSGGTPIVYLPGVSRGALRAADNCPRALSPSPSCNIEASVLTPEQSRLDRPCAAPTLSVDSGCALLRTSNERCSPLALDRLLDERVERAAKQVLDTNYLLDWSPGSCPDLLRWLDDPSGTAVEPTMCDGRQFVQQCKADYGFDPTVDGEVTAARKLGAATASGPTLGAVRRHT